MNNSVLKSLIQFIQRAVHKLWHPEHLTRVDDIPAPQSQEQASQIVMVNQISAAISNLQSLDSILQLIYKQVKETIDLDVFYIALYDEQNQLISFPVLYDGGKFWNDPPREISKTITLAQAIKTREPILINRTKTEIESVRDSFNRLGDSARVAASIIIIPLQAGSRVIGALSVQSYELNAYDDKHRSFLMALGPQVTVAIENARLYEKARQRAQRLASMNEIGREISALNDLPTLLETIYQQIKKILPTDLFFIGLYDARTNRMEFPIMYDEERRWEQQPSLVTDATFSGKTILTRQPLLINHWADTPSQTSTSPIIVGDAARTTTSLMFAPLFSGQNVIGVISAQSYTPNSYNQDDLDLLTGIAAQVAIAIQNTRLLEATQKSAQRLALLNEVNHAISRLKSLPELLEVIYEQASKSIPLDFFLVGLYNHETNEISFPITYDEGLRYNSSPGPVSEGSFMARFLRGEKPLLINQTVTEIEARNRHKTQSMGNENKLSASFIVAPLTIGGQLIGLISAQSYSLNAYDESDLDFLIRIANQVSIAIENSRLYSSAQQEIAERRRIAEQLQITEAKYRELVERAPAVIYSSESGSAGRWFYVSPQIETMLGFTADEWMADPDLWYQQIYPDDRAKTIASERNAIATNSRIVMEYRIFHKNGQLLWVRDLSLSVSVMNNQQYLVQGIIIDITEIKQAELIIKENEEKYHALFLTAQRQAQELSLLSEVQDAIAHELEFPLLIRTVVEAIAKTFGYIYVSLYILEDGYLKLQHQVGYTNVIDQVTPHEGVMGRVVRTGTAVLIQDVTTDPDFLRADNNIRSEISVPLFNGDIVFGVVNVESSLDYQLNENDLRLLTALGEQINIAIRRAHLYAEREENLRREQRINELAHAINSTLDLPNMLETTTRIGVELVGAETGSINLMAEDGTVMNHAYNYNEDPNLISLIPKGQGLTWLVYETGKPIYLDEYSQHPKALPDWSNSGLHAFLCVPISIGGKCLGTLALYNRTPDKKFSQRDFSMVEAIAQEIAISIQNARLFEALQKELEERRRIEHEREAMYKDLEAKNAELERFTYTVSHDLKSPLVTIGGFLGFIEEDIRKGDFSKTERSMVRIREAAKKMYRLLDELLELSRVGRLANPSVHVAFDELAREAVELAQGELSARQVEVRIEAGLPVVFVDRVRMVEVLQNLIVNATKFMGDQSQPLIEIGMRENDFYVRDNGIGIAPEFHEQIFGLFNKLDQFSEGTGIGLALVKRIIEVHGGTIWVESELGKGTTFFFTLADKNKQETT